MHVVLRMIRPEVKDVAVLSLDLLHAVKIDVHAEIHLFRDFVPVLHRLEAVHDPLPRDVDAPVRIVDGLVLVGPRAAGLRALVFLLCDADVAVQLKAVVKLTRAREDVPEDPLAVVRLVQRQDLLAVELDRGDQVVPRPAAAKQPVERPLLHLPLRVLVVRLRADEVRRVILVRVDVVIVQEQLEISSARRQWHDRHLAVVIEGDKCAGTADDRIVPDPAAAQEVHEVRLLLPRDAPVLSFEVMSHHVVRSRKLLRFVAQIGPVLLAEHHRAVIIVLRHLQLQVRLPGEVHIDRDALALVQHAARHVVPRDEGPVRAEQVGRQALLCEPLADLVNDIADAVLGSRDERPVPAVGELRVLVVGRVDQFFRAGSLHLLLSLEVLDRHQFHRCGRIRRKI